MTQLPSQLLSLWAYHCDFLGGTVAGRPVVEQPIIIGDPASLNIAFPADWDSRRILTWRVMTGLFDADYLTKETGQ